MVYIGLILFTIFLVIAVLHVYWGFGGKWKKDETVPTTESGKKILKPGPFACFIVAIGLAGFAILALIRANILNISLPLWIYANGFWIIAAVFILRAIGEFNYVGFFKKIRHTGFGKNDTRFYSPLCLVIGILCILLEMLK
jgi:hypothetical protein